MTNQIAKAVDQSRLNTSQPLSGSTATVNFQASRQQGQIGNNGFAESMANFVKSGTNAYGDYQEQQRKAADERSNEIIRKLTPEQRREAIANGTLLYQDDPDAMNMLRQKSGRSAAYDVEDEINSKIQNGEFDDKDRKYVEEYRQTRLSAAAKAYAESAGIDENDPEYQAGYNADIVQRNAGIFDAHAQRRSKWFQAQAAVNTRGDLAPLLDDPNVMQSPSGGGVIAGYFNNGMKTGQFPSDRQAIDSLTMLVKEAQNKPGGANLLKSLAEQELHVLGGARKVKDIMDPDVYQAAIVKAQVNEYQQNAEQTRTFELNITTALNQDNPSDGWTQLQKIREANQWVQNSTEMTPQKSALINAEQALIAKVRQQSAESAENLVKSAQQDNRVSIIKQQIQARTENKQVLIDPKMQEVTSETGEFKQSDLATAASQMIEDLDRSSLPDAKKDQMKAAWLRADIENGPFVQRTKTLITDAQREWEMAVRTGEPGDFSRINELQRAYAADPATVGAVFPDQADFLEQVKDMAEAGVDPQVLIDAQRSKKGISQDEQKLRNEKWAEIMNDTSNKDLSAIPGPLQRIARSLFDGYNERSGNPDLAKAKLTDWLNKNTVAFSEPSDDSAYRGRLSKKDLMADPDDVNSWESGKAIVEDTVKGLSENPAWSDTGMTVETADDGAITITSVNGKRIRISKQSLQLIHQARQSAAAEAKFAKEKAGTQRGQQMYNDVIRGGIKGPL